MKGLGALLRVPGVFRNILTVHSPPSMSLGTRRSDLTCFFGFVFFVFVCILHVFII